MSDVKKGWSFSTIRDEFAARAMQAMMPFHQMKTVQMKMNMHHHAPSEDLDHASMGATSQMTGGEFNYDELAADAYQMADAMLRARDVKKVDVLAFVGEPTAEEPARVVVHEAQRPD